MSRPLLTVNEFRFVGEAFNQLKKNGFGARFWRVGEVTIAHKLIRIVNTYGGSYFYFGKINEFGNDRVFYKDPKTKRYVCVDSIQEAIERGTSNDG